LRLLALRSLLSFPRITRLGVWFQVTMAPLLKPLRCCHARVWQPCLGGDHVSGYERSAGMKLWLTPRRSHTTNMKLTPFGESLKVVFSCARTSVQPLLSSTMCCTIYVAATRGVGSVETFLRRQHTHSVGVYACAIPLSAALPCLGRDHANFLGASALRLTAAGLLNCRQVGAIQHSLLSSLNRLCSITSLERSRDI